MKRYVVRALFRNRSKRFGEAIVEAESAIQALQIASTMKGNLWNPAGATQRINTDEYPSWVYVKKILYGRR